jgi:hypothetical protein
MTVHEQIAAHVDVRHANHDLSHFAAQIVQAIDDDPAAVIDLSRFEEHGNRIVLRIVRSVGENES